MSRILGLGGVFFLCENVENYRKWWKDIMGAPVESWGSMEWPADGKGRTMMSPFAGDSEYLKPSTARFMINLRVDDVVSLMKKAADGGAKVVGEVEDTDYGIFGWFIDPEGIKIELWQET